MHITKNFKSAAQLSARVKIFCSEQQQVRAAVKKLEGTLCTMQDLHNSEHFN
jgi:hypothetical protein